MDPVVISLLCVWGLAWVFFIAQIVRTSQQQAANGGIFIVGPNNGKVRREKHGVFIAQRRTASLPLSSPTRTHTLHSHTATQSHSTYHPALAYPPHTTSHLSPVTSHLHPRTLFLLQAGYWLDPHGHIGY